MILFLGTRSPNARRTTNETFTVMHIRPYEVNNVSICISLRVVTVLCLLFYAFAYLVTKFLNFMLLLAMQKAVGRVPPPPPPNFDKTATFLQRTICSKRSIDHFWSHSAVSKSSRWNHLQHSIFRYRVGQVLIDHTNQLVAFGVLFSFMTSSTCTLRMFTLEINV